MSHVVGSVHLRGVELGRGRPKICVPLTGATETELLEQVAELPYDDLDLVELRIDHFDGVVHTSAALDALARVRRALPDDVPLLFTFRTRGEGGQRDYELRDYERLLLAAAASRDADAIDVEMFTELGVLERIVNGAHESGVQVVMSSHDFEATPTHDQIVARLTLQQDLGADVVKIAVMPQTPADVLTLMTATDDFRAVALRPAITMAMGPLGVISRLAGETFGSCLTFGSSGRPSAPGQVAAGPLRAALELVHAAQPVEASAPSPTTEELPVEAEADPGLTAPDETAVAPPAKS